MEFGSSDYLGESTSSTPNYSGRHRSFATFKGVGFIPLGDRNRDKPEYGIDYLEERMSIDKYTKYHGS